MKALAPELLIIFRCVVSSRASFVWPLQQRCMPQARMCGCKSSLLRRLTFRLERLQEDMLCLLPRRPRTAGRFTLSSIPPDRFPLRTRARAGCSTGSPAQLRRQPRKSVSSTNSYSATTDVIASLPRKKGGALAAFCTASADDKMPEKLYTAHVKRLRPPHLES